MPEITFDVKRVQFGQEQYFLFQNALLKRDTIQSGKLSAAAIVDGKIYENRNCIGDESDLVVLGDDVLVIDVVDLISAMFDSLDDMLLEYEKASGEIQHIED